jgi:hypothetical protein
MTEIRAAFDYVETFEDHELLTQYDSTVIKTTLRGVGISPEDYILIGGANLVLRGILDSTPDIDLLVSDRGFGILAQEPEAKLKNPPMRAQLEGATNRSVSLRSHYTGMPISATAYMGNGYYPISFKSHKSRAELVDNIPCISIEDIIGSKTALAREKDIAHLKQIASSIGRTILIPEVSRLYPWDS